MQKYKWFHFFTLFTLILGCFSPLSAEIETIRISWDPESCSATCRKQIEKRFLSLQRVSTVENNFDSGQTTIYWQPRRSMTSRSIFRILKQLKLDYDAVTIRIRGTISHVGNRMYVKSLGDNSSLELVSTFPQSTSDLASQRYKKPSLDDALRDKLTQAEDNSLLVTVEGELLEINRQPTMKVLVNRIEVHGK